MATRVLVSLIVGSDPQPVITALTALGAVSVRPPQAELPEVLVAEVDEATGPPQEWAERAARLPGVEAAEVDRMRWGY